MRGLDEQLMRDFKEVAKKDHLLPVKVSEFYAKMVQEEIDAIGIGGPLYRCVYPTRDKLEMKGPGEVSDFVQEYNHYPIEGNTDIVRQYSNRLLFMTTEDCVSFCAYCFRTIKLAESSKIVIEDSLDKLIAYLEQNKELEEVILSGGDPVLVNPEKLENIFARVKAVGIKHLRLHTRSIVYNPDLISDELIAVLKKYDVRLVFHVMHPYEINEEVAAMITKLHNQNIRLYNQNPLLRGINDDPRVLKELFTKLDNLRVRQLSVFTSDVIKYSASYRIPYKRICEIFDWLNYNSSAWVNSVRLVSAVPVGKARRENIIKWENGIITFEIDGKQFEYVDFPEELYTPSDNLLWRENK